MAAGEARARDLRTRLGLEGESVDLDAVARELGITVVREKAMSDVLGVLLSRDGRTVIGLNPDHAPVRQRFMLAHLLGHHQLRARRGVLLDLVDRHTHGPLASLPTDREEAAANRFAAALLMPEPQVRRMALEMEWGTSPQLVDVLSGRFQVSRTAMAYRLMQLGIIIDC